jgi:RND family efflux transporter MFP subunit
MAKTNENAARTDLERARELYAERAMAQAELEAIEQKYDVAKAQALAAMAQADIASQQLKNASITSLISGTITKRTTALGANVSPEAPLFAVQDLSKLKLVTSVDAPTLLRLKKGLDANLHVEDLGVDVKGRIASLVPSLDAHSRRAEVEIEIDDHNGTLMPNMFIDGSLVLSKTTNALLVPNRALVMTDSSPQVFRVRDGKIEVVNTRLGQRDVHHSQIIDGLNEGDLIAVSGLDRLRDGVVVTVEMAN